MKETIFENWNNRTINIHNNNAIPQTLESIAQNLKKIHTIAVDEYLQSKPHHMTTSTRHKPIGTNTPTENQTHSCPTTSRQVSHPAVISPWNKPIISTFHHLHPVCQSQKHHPTSLLMSKVSYHSTLTAQDLWDDPVAVAALLQRWDDAMGTAGGGMGSRLMWV